MNKNGKHNIGKHRVRRYKGRSGIQVRKWFGWDDVLDVDGKDLSYLTYDQAKKEVDRLNECNGF